MPVTPKNPYESSPRDGRDGRDAFFAPPPPIRHPFSVARLQSSSPTCTSSVSSVASKLYKLYILYKLYTHAPNHLVFKPFGLHPSSFTLPMRSSTSSTKLYTLCHPTPTLPHTHTPTHPLSLRPIPCYIMSIPLTPWPLSFGGSSCPA
jgi:hypothetical protein